MEQSIIGIIEKIKIIIISHEQLYELFSKHEHKPMFYKIASELVEASIENSSVNGYAI